MSWMLRLASTIAINNLTFDQGQYLCHSITREANTPDIVSYSELNLLSGHWDTKVFSMALLPVE